jgi:hypothetical protein
MGSHNSQGNNQHNSKVKEKGVGILIPKYRQKRARPQEIPTM